MKNKWALIFIILILVIGAWLIFTPDGNKDQGFASSNVGTSVGDTAPEFSFATIDGNEFVNDDLNGNIVVITSSAAWCNTCVIEAKEFSQVYPDYSEDAVVFITVDIDPRNSIEAIQEFKATTNSPWYYANSNGGKEIIERLKLNRFEITYVVDRDGVIVYKDSKITAAEELSKIIESAL